MTALAIDLGATKLSLAVFTRQGTILLKKTVALDKRTGSGVGDLITLEALAILNANFNIRSISIVVPGIYHPITGRVWAPNIPGWEDYPLLQQMEEITGVPIIIDSDRAAYVLGETWMGAAKGCRNVIYLAVGTGIGAGILVDGVVLRGEHDIAGAIGWMALQQPFEEKYVSCGCFEHHASGEGIAKVARELLEETKEYNGVLGQKPAEELTAYDVFVAYQRQDPIAIEVFNICIRFWGMAVANLVSLFNPEKIILGGGVFGPAVLFIPEIVKEAARWAQPISMRQVQIEGSLLGADAGLFGAGFIAWQQIKEAVTG